MKLVSLLPVVAALPFVALASGCYVQAEAGTLTRFEGSPVSQKVPYASGQAVRIVSANGNVTVAKSSSAADVSVKFSPFTMDKDENEAGAQNAMNTKLHLIAETQSNGDIVLKVTRDEGSSGYLGADIEVGMPSGFDGAFEVDQNNGEVDADLTGGTPLSTDVQDTGGGSVTVLGAAGPLTIKTSAGDATVSVQKWAAKGQDGTIETGAGDVSLQVPAGANGTIQASVGGSSDTITAPTTWSSAGEGQSMSFTFGDGNGANVVISTDLGNVGLTQ